MADGPEWVAFHVVDWKAGTSWLPRTLRSVYFDICVRIWETAKPVPPSEAKMIVADLPNGQEMIDHLVELGKLERLAGGSLTNERAMEEAAKAFAKVNQWRVAGRASARARAARSGGNDRSTGVPTEGQQSGNELESELDPDANASGRARARTPARAPAHELPDWLPQQEWNAYLEMRKAKKAKPTDRAVELLLTKLEKMRDRGIDLAVVLDQSTMNNWTDVFEPKPDRSNGGGKPRTGVNRRNFDEPDYYADTKTGKL